VSASGIGLRRAELIQCVGINNELFPPLTACPICDARWLRGKKNSQQGSIGPHFDSARTK
jgi:hypothetical protein